MGRGAIAPPPRYATASRQIMQLLWFFVKTSFRTHGLAIALFRSLPTIRDHRWEWGQNRFWKLRALSFLTILVPWQWNKKCKGWMLHHTKLQNLLRPASLPYFYHGFPEWLLTRRPRGPFTVTQAMLSSLIITLYALRFIFFCLFSKVNKQTWICLFVDMSCLLT